MLFNASATDYVISEVKSTKNTSNVALLSGGSILGKNFYY